jgi:hypothetical protein
MMDITLQPILREEIPDVAMNAPAQGDAGRMDEERSNFRDSGIGELFRDGSFLFDSTTVGPPRLSVAREVEDRVRSSGLPGLRTRPCGLT